jgi:hypothetical protein
MLILDVVAEAVHNTGLTLSRLKVESWLWVMGFCTETGVIPSRKALCAT